MRSILGISLGAALAGLVTLGGAGDAPAQGSSMSNAGGSGGYRDGKAAVGARNAARPAPGMKEGAPRAKRSYYRSAAPRTCGQLKFWSTAKGRCIDARTPPALK
jgi:hypothetical protein